MKRISEHLSEINTEVDLENYNIFLEDYINKDNLTPESLQSTINMMCIPMHDRAYGNEDWDWYLYENLNTTLETNKFIDKIQNSFKHYNLDIEKGNFDSKYEQFKIKCDKFKELAKNKNFIELCDNANYEIITNDYWLTIKPIKGEDITDRVYKFPVIYHYTPKFIYEEKIKDFGISPKGRSKQKPHGSRYKRIYCFYSKDPMKLAPTFARFKKRFTLMDYFDNENMKNNINKGFVLLTIDLSKYKERKIRFFEDSGQRGLNAFWTYDFIPYWCITKVEDIKL